MLTGNPETIAGFNRPEPAPDKLILELRRKYGLPEPASLADIEPVALRLLADPLTSLDAAELVLNRYVTPGSEDKRVHALFSINFKPRQVFGCLLLERSLEDYQRQQYS